MRPRVQEIALRRKPILRPHLFDMNQRTLPLAEQEMLQRREWEEVGG